MKLDELVDSSLVRIPQTFRPGSPHRNLNEVILYLLVNEPASATSDSRRVLFNLPSDGRCPGHKRTPRSRTRIDKHGRLIGNWPDESDPYNDFVGGS